MDNESGGKTQKAVYEIAVDQAGYFTAAQARAAGVTAEAVAGMRRRGNLERVSTGVYRIAGFPPNQWGQYMAASLWPETRRTGVRGTISHASALNMYGISDASSSKIHITLPKSVRIRRSPPAHVVVHRAALEPDDIRVMNAVPVTTPERTIRDCHAAHLGSAIVRGAIADAKREGWLKPEAASRLERELLNPARSRQ